MKLWVLRHGEAEPRANSDAERRLTAHGREQVLHKAGRLLGQPLQAIIASPYVRAQQTAALVHDTLGFVEPVRTVPWLRPESDVREVIAHIERLGLEHVLLVSHQPLVSGLVGMLSDGNRHGPGMGTASLAELEGEAGVLGEMRVCGIYHAR
ncbi:phosphohistidine phosphatase SixA [Pseudomonas plecoglossicida]|uniref:phosphohistidine phosphatase SixA n=1 Tax=Pseudomonas plecoglossicida TaxID=70775 RepID=UPI003D201C13